MIPVFTEAEHYQYWAAHFAGEAFLKHCVASVHVEAKADEEFWRKIFRHYVADKEFNFISGSSTPKGTVATGVSHCLKYKPYLSKHFFICIDSDYRYLMQEKGFTPAQYVIQTYTYSIENHFCYAAQLNELSEKQLQIKNTIFDFDRFLKAYSQAMYEVLIWHLYLLKRGEEAFPKHDFTQLLNLLQSAHNYDVANNGKAVLDLLEQRCKDKITELKQQFPTVNIDDEKTYFTTLGLTPDTAYLYVRGHNLYDLVCALGNSVTEKLLEQEKQRLEPNKPAITQMYAFALKRTFKFSLDNHLVFEPPYHAMQKIGQDIATLLG
jgi:hypothetical protein